MGVIRRGVEVRSDAVAQIDRFADVDHLAIGVEVLIDAGFGRQRLEFFGDFLGGHNEEIVTRSGGVFNRKENCPTLTVGLFRPQNLPTQA